MRKAALTFAITVVVFLAMFIGKADAMHKHTKLKGQIIAYRPAERVSQVPSHVLNKESFLFMMAKSKSTSQAAIVKLVYEHYGYSDLGDDVLSKAPVLRLNIRRDTTCDETYGDFVQNSPVLGDGKENNDSDGKVIFIEAFQKMNLSSEQPLKCYKLRDGNVRVESSVTSR